MVASLSAMRGSGRAERVTGTPEPTIPPRVDVIDLTGHARLGSRGPYVRAFLGLDDDQAGPLAVATRLDVQVHDWITYLPHARLPHATITAMVTWLLVWLDTACDDHPGIDEFAADLLGIVRDVHAAQRTGGPGEKVGRCPTVLRDESTCATTLRADPYLNRIACPRCSTTWNRETGGWQRLRARQDDTRTEQGKAEREVA